MESTTMATLCGRPLGRWPPSACLAGDSRPPPCKPGASVPGACGDPAVSPTVLIFFLSPIGGRLLFRGRARLGA